MRDFGFRVDGGVWLFPIGTPLVEAAGIALPSGALSNEVRERLVVPNGDHRRVPTSVGVAIDLHSPWELRMISASVDGTGEPVSVCSLDAGVSAEWLGAIERQRAVLLWAYEDVFAAERFFESRVANRVIDPPMLARVALGMAPLTLRAWFGEEQWRHPLFAATPPPWRLLRRHEEEELPHLRA